MRSWEQTNLFSVLPISRVGYYVGKAILSAFCCLSNRQCKQYFMSRPGASILRYMMSRILHLLLLYNFRYVICRPGSMKYYHYMDKDQNFLV